MLADIAMPGKDGYEVCEAIKSDPDLRHVPVLLLSGTFESFDEARARHVGADGHITKPFEAQALVDRVNELLAHAESARPVGGSDTTVLVSERPPTSGDAFDFFDEEFAETSPSAVGRARGDDVARRRGRRRVSRRCRSNMESAVEDEIAEAPEAVAIASFDDDGTTSIRRPTSGSRDDRALRRAEPSRMQRRIPFAPIRSRRPIRRPPRRNC